MADTIHILDYICGTGKSTYILNKLKEISAPRFIYISCLLSEIEERVQEELAHLDVCIPSDENTTKSDDVLQALKQGRNIAATHSLFLRFNNESIKYMKSWGYILIIDEVLDFITPYRKYSSQDVKDLINLDQIAVDEENNGRVKVTQEFEGYYSELKEYSEKGLVYASTDDFTVFNLQIPPDVIKASRECYVLTYLYDSSEMQRFLTLHNISYNHMDVPELKEREILIKSKLKENINIICIKAADEVIRSEVFEVKGLATKKSLNIKFLKKQTELEDEEHRLWLASSTKATNDYADRELCLFLMNTYPNVGLQKYFEQYCTPLDNDRYALSEIVQFIFRGSIRTGKPMDLYIGSPRMKEIFVTWLDTI